MDIREPRDFEKFKEELIPASPDICVVKLSGRLKKAEQRLIRTHRGEDTEYRRLAVRDYALVAMANERLLGGVIHEPNKPPPWMDTAKDMIEELIDSFPSDASMLRETIFFSENPEIRMQFGRSISGIIIPRGEYEDDIAFANGVAIGKIVLEEG